jgi:hypothetical protein
VPALVGQGQVQVVKSHPSWTTAYTGVTQIFDFSIATNLALYLTNSEQRGTALIAGKCFRYMSINTYTSLSASAHCYELADANIRGALVRHVFGVSVEKLPGATPESVAMAEQNIREVRNATCLFHMNIYDMDIPQATIHQPVVHALNST